MGRKEVKGGEDSKRSEAKPAHIKLAEEIESSETPERANAGELLDRYSAERDSAIATLASYGVPEAERSQIIGVFDDRKNLYVSRDSILMGLTDLTVEEQEGVVRVFGSPDYDSINSFGEITEAIRPTNPDLAAALHGLQRHHLEALRISESHFERSNTHDRARIHLLEGEVSSLKEQASNYKKQAGTDPLTGLGNRRLFAKDLVRNIRRSLRTGDKFALYMGDVDNFKNYNDEYGHPSGDSALQHVASTLENQLRRETGDGNYRYGGEEFCGIISDVEDRLARRVLERMRVEVETEPCEVIKSDESPDEERFVTLSIGYVMFDPRDEGVDSSASTEIVQGYAKKLVDNADAALYTAKRGGRNRTVQYRSASLDEKKSDGLFNGDEE